MNKGISLAENANSENGVNDLYIMNKISFSAYPDKARPLVVKFINFICSNKGHRSFKRVCGVDNCAKNKVMAIWNQVFEYLVAKAIKG